MADQTERADLARVYRAIGNSNGEMPASVDAYADMGHMQLKFPDNDLDAVRRWAEAIGATVVRGDCNYSEGTANVWHEFGNRPRGGRHGTWLGWSVDVWCVVSGPSPRVQPEVAPAVLGTGDEPADEAIVPGGSLPPRHPAPAGTAYGLDRNAVRWMAVGAVSWQPMTGGTTRSTADLIEQVGPISWWDADGHQIGDTAPSGRCGESVPQANYDEGLSNADGDCLCQGEWPHPEAGRAPGSAATAHQRDVPPNAGSAS